MCHVFYLFVGETMQNNGLNNYQYYPQRNANAVDINIYSPQAYGSNTTTNPICTPNNNFYSMYGVNTQPNLPLYPQNYNNMINNGYQPEMPNNQNNGEQTLLPNNQTNKTGNNSTSQSSYVEENDKLTKNLDKDEKSNKDDDKIKVITPLTDNYVKSLENYLNDSNPKVRLIGAKELLERFKEDENRKDNPSLIPLLNKVLQDPSLSVRFLGLTVLQLEYSVGDEKTVEILKQIQAENKDKIGEDQLLASEILLKMSAPDKIKLEETK